MNILKKNSESRVKIRGILKQTLSPEEYYCKVMNNEIKFEGLLVKIKELNQELDKDEVIEWLDDLIVLTNDNLTEKEISFLKKDLNETVEMVSKKNQNIFDILEELEPYLFDIDPAFVLKAECYIIMRSYEISKKEEIIKKTFKFSKEEGVCQEQHEENLKVLLDILNKEEIEIAKKYTRAIYNILKENINEDYAKEYLKLLTSDLKNINDELAFMKAKADLKGAKIIGQCDVEKATPQKIWKPQFKFSKEGITQEQSEFNFEQLRIIVEDLKDQEMAEKYVRGFYEILTQQISKDFANKYILILNNYIENRKSDLIKGVK